MHFDIAIIESVVKDLDMYKNTSRYSIKTEECFTLKRSIGGLNENYYVHTIP